MRASEEGLLERRWEFLEEQPDACSVVTRRMELLYLNAAARSLVGPGGLGSPCWEVFPVAEGACASRCPAVRAVSQAEEVVYCEETTHAADGSPVRLGIAIIPIAGASVDGERAILLLRPIGANGSDEPFRRGLVRDAQALRAVSDHRLSPAGAGGETP